MWATAERNEYERQRALELSSMARNLQPMSIRELFYGGSEQTYVLKKVKMSGFNPRPELVLASMPFYPDFVENSDKEEKTKDPDVVLWVPICCPQCEERIIVPVSKMKGVKSVVCDSYKKKVVVSGKDLNAIEILLKCQTMFCKAAFWKDD
ncbi:hypothetical protein Mapa_002516 [Marchantia paleacea]|nr:hypothetical protein Mapa_002516 [Marchantia paleacea]